MIRGLIHGLCWLVKNLMGLFYLPLLVYYKCSKPKRCPPVSDSILFVPGTSLAAKIRSGEISSARTVEAYINRIKEVNPVLNALVEERFDAALEEAKLVDAFVANGEMSMEQIGDRFPLLGVPITIKESVAVAGMSNGAGFKRNGPIRRAEKDADCVSQLKSAGVIVLLVTNTPEFCLNWETFNYVTGRTLNPYDTRRACGGSSGGEAVLLASCSSVIGVGSDLVGSLRLPPTFCGVYGHKPSPGLISPVGHYPSLDYSELYIYATFGPMSRYAIDLPLLTHIMTKPESRSSANLLEKVDPQNIKVYYMESNEEHFLTNPVNEQIVMAIRKIIRRLSMQGIVTKKIELEGFKDSFDLCFLPLLQLNKLQYSFSTDKSVGLELLKTIFCMGTVIPNCFFYYVIKKLFNCLASEATIDRNMKLLNDFKMQFTKVLQDDGVFIYPAFPSTAHFHGQIYSKVLDTSYLGIFNILGLPVTICPVGLDSNSLPICVQVASTPMNDKLCFAIAEELEKNFGGWTSPPYTRQIQHI